VDLDLSELKVAVTGGTGFVGKAVVERLSQEGCKDVACPRSSDFDLCSEDGVRKFYQHYQPEVVIHLAAAYAGLASGRERPAEAFYNNAIMGICLIEFGRNHGLQKLVAVGSSASYPQAAPLPFKEEDLWEDYPHPSNAPYGLAKKMILTQLQAYHQQYGFQSAFLIPANLYGPHDDFSPDHANVIPAIIAKCVDAQRKDLPRIKLWGDGSATRDFLYVQDAAEGIVRAAIMLDEPQPINLGSGSETSVRQLAEKICRVTGFAGDLVWDSTKPSGISRHILDSSRAQASLNFSASTSLDEGLSKTSQWYVESLEA